MAHLFTNHDPYNVHKTLGLLWLLHVAYRVFLLLTGRAVFPESESVAFTACAVLLHTLLPMTSLLLPLPKRRNFSGPMIWPEFRLHSITFATRHVLCCLITLAQLWPQNIFANIVSKMVIVLGTSRIALFITCKWGSREDRTTNSMPYDPSLTEQRKANIRERYAMSQFHATAMAITEDITLAWFPLISIQVSALT